MVDLHPSAPMGEKCRRCKRQRGDHRNRDHACPSTDRRIRWSVKGRFVPARKGRAS